MAKSIYETLATMETETSVPNHGMVPHTLPANKLPTDEEFESPEKLIAWADENDITFEVLQKGVKAFIIDLRAVFKAPPSKKEQEEGKEWTPEYGQEKVNSYGWTVTKRPEGKKDPVAAATEFLSKMSKKERMEWLKENGLA